METKDKKGNKNRARNNDGKLHQEWPFQLVLRKWFQCFLLLLIWALLLVFFGPKIDLDYRKDVSETVSVAYMAKNVWNNTIAWNSTSIEGARDMANRFVYCFKGKLREHPVKEGEGGDFFYEKTYFCKGKDPLYDYIYLSKIGPPDDGPIKNVAPSPFFQEEGGEGTNTNDTQDGGGLPRSYDVFKQGTLSTVEYYECMEGNTPWGTIVSDQGQDSGHSLLVAYKLILSTLCWNSSYENNYGSLMNWMREQQTVFPNDLYPLDELRKPFNYTLDAVIQNMLSQTNKTQAYSYLIKRHVRNKGGCFAGDMKRLLMKNGPFAVEMTVYGSTLYVYTGGVFTTENLDKYRSPYRGNRVFMAYGWGKDDDATMNYFSLAGTWGVEWGMNGTAKVSDMDLYCISNERNSMPSVVFYTVGIYPRFDG